VPLYLILYIELGVPNVKENLLRDLTHELRHSITDARTRRKLKESGVNTEPDFIYLHIGAKDVNQSIAYAYMLEDEAVRVQDKFVPQASNNLYPELQSLQRLLHTFTYKDLAELESDVAANRQFKILTESFVDHYIHHIEIHSADVVLPPKLEGLMAKLQSKEITSHLAIDLAVKDFDLHAKVIDGRLNEELYDFLRLKIMQVFKKKELRLMRAYRQLQESSLIR
jgi:hypothetical protein